MMQRPAPHPTQRATFVHFCKEPATPIQITAVRAGADKGRLDSVSRHPLCEAAIFGGVFFGSEVSSTTPRFISYTPVTHFKRLSIPAGCSHICKRRCACR